MPPTCISQVDLAGGEILGGLVGGDAELVQAAGLVLGVVEHDRVAPHRQAVGAGEARGARTDDRDAPAGLRRAAVGMALPRHQRVGRVPLQTADLDRPAFRGLAYAGPLAEVLGRTDPRAHAAEDVLVEDCPCRLLRAAGGDLADEERDVDVCGAGGDAGRVVAEIAPVGRHRRLVAVEWRVEVGEVLRDLVSAQAAGGDAGRQGIGHVASSRVTL